jgi:hypothetical protein
MVAQKVTPRVVVSDCMPTTAGTLACWPFFLLGAFREKS